ncbi:Mrp/NBP35 family ATP-binding protein [Stratiformator vulcanicus]|uniref:Iron-sulfur cluster carrier protein n=1 Tax=Stratiformator vulcanicus TaxID=2527980 RepID=A0A517R7U1_9PLAN|nr:Mrp/NBP35 family ATP-binding protein [Stratiformator vulcanicus]QDT39922.1 Flagellum site-determining protein YlxH [Stratiformator vulcanicus]
MPDLQSTLAKVTVPKFGRTLGDLKMLKSVSDESVTVALPVPMYSATDELISAMNAAAGKDLNVEFTTDIRGKHAGGKVGLNVANVIAVGSGKGGVGKSTIAASLACGLDHAGAKVGLMDADVYGPSIPHLMGVTATPAVREVTGPDGQQYQRMVPIDVDGMPVLSMGFLIEKDQAVVWRGPMLHKALQQFLQQTEWGELDYLVIDLPPGTGDVALTLSQMMGLSGAVVVCSPQEVALLDAVKACSMYNQVEIPILGIVENMSGDLFGRGGAKQQATKLGLPFLGEIPAIASIREAGDAGKMAGLFDEGNPAREPLLAMCEAVSIEVAKEVIESGPAPSLQIL